MDALRFGGMYILKNYNLDGKPISDPDEKTRMLVEYLQQYSGFDNITPNTLGRPERPDGWFCGSFTLSHGKIFLFTDDERGDDFTKASRIDASSYALANQRGEAHSPAWEQIFQARCQAMRMLIYNGDPLNAELAGKKQGDATRYRLNILSH